ncbi:Concanavalin A-like lectin/glucanase domain containing protein, partial [Trema orientale]
MSKPRKNSNQFECTEHTIWAKEGKFTFEEIVKAIEDFNEKCYIGKGGFHNVYKEILPSVL